MIVGQVNRPPGDCGWALWIGAAEIQKNFDCAFELDYTCSAQDEGSEEAVISNHRLRACELHCTLVQVSKPRQNGGKNYANSCYKPSEKISFRRSAFGVICRILASNALRRGRSAVEAAF
jgi:hypothetical protein